MGNKQRLMNSDNRLVVTRGKRVGSGSIGKRGQMFSDGTKSNFEW